LAVRQEAIASSSLIALEIACKLQCVFSNYKTHATSTKIKLEKKTLVNLKNTVHFISLFSQIIKSRWAKSDELPHTGMYKRNTHIFKLRYVFIMSRP
jgi:2-keto-4-pentenoate hydratase/2-oxohepta-3-ene-1,7-dioic acid hydratase in catechol pathway